MAEPESFSFAADFRQGTREDWRKLVETALKGAPYQRLENKTYDGFTIEPLYDRARNATVIPRRTTGAEWTLMQRIDHPDPALANAQALEDLENGATGLVLVFVGSVSANGFGLDPSPTTLARALDGVDVTAGIVIDLNLSPATRQAVREFAALVKRRNVNPSSVDLRTSINPVGGFAMSGSSAQSWKEFAPKFAATIAELAGEGFNGPFAVADGRVIHNAGGSDTQELAFAIASAVAYLRALEAGGIALETARNAIYFRLSADADQFLTMAKFRAVRKLWAKIEQACGLTPKPVLVTAETAWRMMTRHDPYANILRTAIAVTAAGLGGADSIVALPHTAPLGLPDPFARRVVRNMQLILLEESNLARVTDPAAGSGALEAFTEELCTGAWSQFRDIENVGGIWTALEKGTIQQNAAAVRVEREKAVARRKDALTGTNIFPDLHEIMPAVLGVSPRTPASDDHAAVTSTALPRIRLAEPFERLRDKSDKMLAGTGARPLVFLANLGTPADFIARASFAKNFFEAGGIEASNDESADRPSLTESYKASRALLVCLCSSDKIYEKDAVAAAQTLKSAGAKHIYLAGRPGQQEAALRAAGVQSFIYEGCDALATLQAAYDILGA